mmetsp:Transcript_5230/g.13125  ORF Transcript_5230/g.13125 Transcript_5230/m.13125 type:complete len:309 (+) Transcript_5230:1069-1995(+)
MPSAILPSLPPTRLFCSQTSTAPSSCSNRIMTAWDDASIWASTRARRYFSSASSASSLLTEDPPTESGDKSCLDSFWRCTGSIAASSRSVGVGAASSSMVAGAAACGGSAAGAGAGDGTGGAGGGGTGAVVGASPSLSARLEGSSSSEEPNPAVGRARFRRAGRSAAATGAAAVLSAASSISLAALKGYAISSPSDQSTWKLPSAMDVTEPSNHPLPVNFFRTMRPTWRRGSAGAAAASGAGAATSGAGAGAAASGAAGAASRRRRPKKDSTRKDSTNGAAAFCARFLADPRLSVAISSTPARRSNVS